MRSLLILVTITLAACSEGSPLGGPYGGTSDPPGPNEFSGGADPSDSSTSNPTNPNDPNPPNPNDSTNPDGGVVIVTSDGGTQVNTSGTDAGGIVQTQSAPTWTQIWTNYLASGTKGNCAKNGCHSQMSSASSSYTWLKGQKQINGANSALVNSATSRLTWYGGDMPKGGGPTSWPQAVTDMNAWAAAGGLNN